MTHYDKIRDIVDEAISSACHASIEVIQRTLRETVNNPTIDADAKIEAVLQLHQLQRTIDRKVSNMLLRLHG